MQKRPSHRAIQHAEKRGRYSINFPRSFISSATDSLLWKAIVDPMLMLATGDGNVPRSLGKGPLFQSQCILKAIDSPEKRHFLLMLPFVLDMQCASNNDAHSQWQTPMQCQRAEQRCVSRRRVHATPSGRSYQMYSVICCTNNAANE